MLWIALLAPPLLALILAFIQDLFYRGLVASGRMPPEEQPFFGILVFRGLLIGLAVIAVTTIVLKTDTPLEEDPMLGEEQQEQVRRMKAGEPAVRLDEDGVPSAQTEPREAAAEDGAAPRDERDSDIRTEAPGMDQSDEIAGDDEGGGG